MSGDWGVLRCGRGFREKLDYARESPVTRPGCGHRFTGVRSWISVFVVGSVPTGHARMRPVGTGPTNPSHVSVEPQIQLLGVAVIAPQCSRYDRQRQTTLVASTFAVSGITTSPMMKIVAVMPEDSSPNTNSIAEPTTMTALGTEINIAMAIRSFDVCRGVAHFGQRT